MAELSWRTPSADIVTVAAFSVADRLYIGHTYIVLLYGKMSCHLKLAAAFDHNRHLPPYLYSAINIRKIVVTQAYIP